MGETDVEKQIIKDIEALEKRYQEIQAEWAQAEKKEKGKK